MNNIRIYVCFALSFASIEGFVPHPAIRLGGQAGESITHTEITQLGFIRSLSRYFLDTEIKDPNDPRIEKLRGQNTIDAIYQLIYPNWDSDRIKLYSYPLKKVIDEIQVRNALVDLNPSTKNLAPAHFDSETFAQSNQRVMELRNKVIADVRDPNNDLEKARGRMGDLLHTLQDFYSHSNWVEMGKTGVNEKIGIEQNIGRTATPSEATCTSDGCQKLKSKCNILQRFILKNCPMEYYDCKNNIRPEINAQGILTTGYVSSAGEPSTKPTNVEKCSHGSVMDSSAHQTPVGGINKDTMTPVYSPHYHLHFEAVKFAVDATERFFNDLRRDIGNEQFDRLFAIHPTETQLEQAEVSIRTREKFHFLTSTMSIGLSTSDMNFQKTVKQRLEQILAVLFSWTNSDAPTFDLSDQGVDKSDVNIHSGSLIIDKSISSGKRTLRKHFLRSFRRQ